MMETAPQFIRGIFAFSGSGLSAPALMGTGSTYAVPSDRRSQLIYFRAGNSADRLVVVSLHVDGKPFRVFPVGAKAAIHVSLAVVEDLMPDSKLEALVSAPSGVSGEIVLDIGLVEI